MTTLLKLLIVMTTIVLYACGGGSGGGGNPSQPPPQQQASIENSITNLENSGDLPVLDRDVSISGIDSNANGYRDDIELYVNNQQGTQAQKNSLLNASKALTEAMMIAGHTPTEPELRSLTLNLSKTINCIFQQYQVDTANLMSSRIEKLTINTKERFNAYMEYSELIDGRVIDLPSGDSCE